MADQPKTPDTEAAGGDAAPKSKMPVLAIVAVAVAIGGGLGAAVIGPMVAKKMGKVVEAPKDSAALAAEEEAKAAEGAKGEGKEGAAKETVRLLENLVLNPAGSGGSRFLLLSVAIETGTPKAMEDITAHDAELRDIILSTLGTKTVEELTDMAVREGLKKLVQDAVNARFGKTAVKRLYFPQFVVQ